jgi:hypothetical protein
MNWLKQIVIKWVRDDWENAAKPMSTVGESETVNMDRAIKFSVLPATGGCIVELRRWNNKDHEWQHHAHIIPDGEDVAHRVGQIVSMEFLRR